MVLLNIVRIGRRMAKKAVLDALIKRADFALQDSPLAMNMGTEIKLAEFIGNGQLGKLLRKPDFQRETNHWSPSQISGLVKSFVSNELIPALILWKSNSFIFVIDGAHRLSALKAWADNDYGDGTASGAFFSQNINASQKTIALETRKLVEAEVGRYSDYVSMTEEQLAADHVKAGKFATIFNRALHVQWIHGNQDVAESSFFKINSQGTVLDQTEETLLKNRNRSYAIAARSIVRAGTGHNYWSKFSQENQKRIEGNAKELNDLLFQPDVTEPLKTLDLPLNGTASPVDSLKSLIDIFAIIDGESDAKKSLAKLTDDADGQQTIELLKRSLKVARRMTGNDAGSLGLHPAAYFYTEKGKPSRYLFLGVLSAISDAVRNNDKSFFKRFTSQRAKIENTLIARKSLIIQGLANVNSTQRVDKIRGLLKSLVIHFEKQDQVLDRDILRFLGLEGSAGDLKQIEAPVGFSTEIKSAIFLQTAVNCAPRCNICGGLLHVVKSASYDHKTPVAAGGQGHVANAQIVHPFCNTGIKGSDVSQP
ncbi:DUF262 domain-containing protein [Paragemmobacter aquarius]|nr:DUF262 domain-containing protein [Gemmobacter aquarius]